VWLWPDSYQGHNVIIRQLHEHDNFGEFVAISTMRIQVPTWLSMHADDKECKTQNTVLSESWKGNMGARM
jgi:hypothetical protein